MLPYSSRAFDSQECFPLRRLGDPIIAMMQPAEARPTEHATTPHAVCPACRSLFAKPKMCAVLMVVVDILGEKSLQVALVQRNYVVQQITPATLDPALRDSVLPRTLNCRSDRSNFHALNRGWNFQSILCIVIQNQEPGSGFIGEGFSQLLNDPTTSRMAGHIEVQDASAVMSDYEEAVEHAEGEGWHREEVHSSDGFAVRRKVSQRFAPSGSLGARCIHREIVRSETSKPSMRSSP
jgi:hypothetical protein